MNIKRKPNNQGSTMIMVVLCIAFLGILGSLMLSVSLINYQMKKVESKSKNNFYSCEKALQEIKSGLEEMAATDIKDTYTVVLKDYASYSTLSEENRDKEIQALAISKIQTTLGTEPSGISDKFLKYLSSPIGFTIEIGTVIQNKSTLPYSITIQNVKVKYLDNNYNTSITSDLCIKLPTFTLAPDADILSYSMKQPFENYAVVADGGIVSESTDGTNRINGNIYTGNGISVSNPNPALMTLHTLELNGDSITTRGSITAKNTAALTIGNSTNPIIWANNITTDSTTIYNNQTSLNIHGICLAKDDLAINGQKSNVTLSGAYVGFTGTHTAEGSAIMINGSNSSLNLSGLSSLILAGRAHVTVDDSVLSSFSNVNIMTGESLAIKSNQRAYLIPGNYIYLNDKSAMHNPLTKDDLSGSTVSVKIPSSASPINYKNYLKASPNQYKIAAKQTALGETTTLRYYYMNFDSGKKADQYLADFMNSYPNLLQNMDVFKVGSIKLPATSKIVSAGNVMYYDTTSTPATIKFKPGKSASFTDDANNDANTDDYISKLMLKGGNGVNDPSAFIGSKVENETVSNLSNLYYNMTHYLSLTVPDRKMNDADEVVASNVIRSGITKALSDLQAGGYTAKSTGFTAGFTVGDYVSNNISNPSDKSIIVANGNAEIKPNTFFNGILVASGNVTIGSGAVINGLIIAAGNQAGTLKGDIELKDNVTIHGRVVAMNDVLMGKNCNIECTADTRTSFDSDLKVENFLGETFKTDAQILWSMFLNPDVKVNIDQNTSVSDIVNISNLVTCENWRKN
jgi:hypothetical protein